MEYVSKFKNNDHVLIRFKISNNVIPYLQGIVEGLPITFLGFPFPAFLLLF
jgi:hypothetical protein